MTELEQYIPQLIKAAQDVAKNAYAPYSNYQVGAALLTEDNTIFTGCNVENASYGLTICAERVAIFKAVCAGHRKWKAIAIHAPQPPAPLPCGACRQVMSENGNTPTVIINDAGDTTSIYHFSEILPLNFTF